MENMSKTQNNENQKNQTYHLTNSSRFTLPILFILLTALAICFKAIDNFKADINVAIVWALFIVTLLYVVVAIIDAFMRKGKIFKYLIIMSILVTISDIMFIILFYV